MDIKHLFSLGFWNVGIIRNSFDEIAASPETIHIDWMNHNYKDRFFADPFPLREDDDHYYILAEEFKYIRLKGTIVLLTVSKHDFRLIEREDILETNYHLSFPLIWNSSIIPEQYKSGKLTRYSLDGRELNVICNYPVIDPVVFIWNGTEYLIGTMIRESKAEANTNLFLFEKNNEGMFILLSETPVLKDITCSRCAGKIFEYKGRTIRPAQNCKDIYGGALEFNEILSVAPTYTEKHLLHLDSSNEKRFSEGLHTFNMISDNAAIVDGFQYERRLLLKIRMKVRRVLGITK